MYRITFYQAGVEGIPSEIAKTKRKACAAASEFVNSFGPIPGHRREGNVQRDGYTRLTNWQGTECCASISRINP